jgi:hypothetical protein
MMRGLLRHWQTILVAGYAVATFTWTLPPGVFPPKPAIDRVTEPALMLLGLWQAWDMFSPDPRTDDVCVEVAFTDADGTSDRRMLTDMVAMGTLDRWRKDRWRKYCNDHLRLDAEQHLWRPFAEYAVRQLRLEGHDPVAVELVRWWRPCEREVRPQLRADVRQAPWRSFVFYRSPVPRGWER